MNDVIYRQAAIEVLSLGKEILSRVLDEIDVVGIDREKYSWGLGLIEAYIEDIKELPSAQSELCEDAVSRQRLLSDLKELVTAWKKYPVMAEEIKGVEAAIGYVELIPSVKPNSKELSETHKALDTISRQDAIAKLKEHRKIFCKNRLDFTILPDKDKARVDEIDACIAALINLPPAEQEIIRCKNCKYRDENWKRVSVRWLPCMDARTGSNWYCGSAERREE